MQSIGIEPDELRLLKQAVNNNICLAVFETFKQKTETLRKDGSKLAVP